MLRLSIRAGRFVLAVRIGWQPASEPEALSLETGLVVHAEDDRRLGFRAPGLETWE